MTGAKRVKRERCKVEVERRVVTVNMSDKPTNRVVVVTKTTRLTASLGVSRCHPGGPIGRRG